MAVKLIEVCDRCKREVFEMQPGTLANYNRTTTTLLKQVTIDRDAYFLCADCLGKVKAVIGTGDAKRA